MGRDEEWGEPSRYGLDTPRLMAPEEMGPGATSPRAALLKMPASTTTEMLYSIGCKVIFRIGQPSRYYS
jgi:hypothetical protein